jgi:hypothetical protein
VSHSDRDGATTRASRGWYALLALPFAGLLWPPLYVRDEPRLGGVPFFYWYQFAWVVLSAALTWVVVRMTEAPGDDDPDRP